LLGNTFRDRGEVDRALRVHQNVIARSNLNAKQKQKAMFALGQDFFAAGMLDRAESVFLELSESNNKWVSKDSVSEALRTIYEQTQEWQKAIDAAKLIKKNQKKFRSASNNNALNMDNIITHYYCELADESLQKGNLHEVDSFILEAKKNNKQSTRLMSLEGDIAFHQNQFKDALNHYLKAIEHDSRLQSNLFDKMDKSAQSSGQAQWLMSRLLAIYQKHEDVNIFDAILQLANMYGSNQEIDRLVDDVLKHKKLPIQSISKASNYIKAKSETSNAEHLESSDLGLQKIHHSLAVHLQGAPSFRCEHCGYKMHDHLWRCPACNHWDTVDQC